MIYSCCCCDFSHEDNKNEMEAVEFLMAVQDPEFAPVKCPDCEAVVVPEHFSEDDRSGMFRLVSKCPNAHICCMDNAYRAECEALVFYPGCLNFIWHELHDINLMLNKKSASESG